MNSLRAFLSLAGRTGKVLFSTPFRTKEFLQQLFFVANGSLLIVLFCVSFAAIVTILEASFHMKIVIQNDSMVPGFAAVLILRELGPVVTALLLTSRVGAGFTAEVGLMKTTEQIDALRMLGIDPVQYLVVPRFVATILGAALLALLASMV
ncbi:MAG TPA: ABC transporter permease, partial [Pseudobdellovibrionaceae bacterium]|nr:ABC transporter permease [Pseudobdellovibrionaceae bacterium]